MRHYFSLPSFPLPSLPSFSLPSLFLSSVSVSIPASPVPPASPQYATSLLRQSGDTAQGLVPYDPSSYASQNHDKHLSKHVHCPAATMMHTVELNFLKLHEPSFDHINTWNEHIKKWDDKDVSWDGYSTSKVSHPGVLSRLWLKKYNSFQLRIPLLPIEEFVETAAAVAEKSKNSEEFGKLFEEKIAPLRGELEKMVVASCMDLLRISKSNAQDSKPAIDFTGEPIDEQTNEIPNNYPDETQYINSNLYKGYMGPEKWLIDNDFLPAPGQRSQERFVPPSLLSNYMVYHDS